MKVKAYAAEYPNVGYGIEVGADVVFGTDLNDAMAGFFDGDSVFKTWPNGYKGYKRYNYNPSDIKFYRLEALDDYEDLNDMEIVEKLITDACWVYQLGDTLFTEDNFNRDKFEKAWIDVRGEVRRIA